ncbi:homing endonuclease [Vibrio phage EniLVp02]
MNYQKIYWDIINRAIGRTIEGYTEKHHVYPACLCRYSKRFGEREDYLFDRNADDLIVKLTAREHYVAHQLLAKMYPTEPGLQLAAYAMTLNSDTHIRNNRLYEWVRRRHANAMSESQAGKRNTQYGRRFKWMHHPDDRRTAKVPIDQVDKFVKAGYEFGLKPESERYLANRINKRGIPPISPDEAKERRRVEGRQLAIHRFTTFIEGDYPSINQFAAELGISHVAIVKSFKRYIPGYSNVNGIRSKNIKKLLFPIYENLHNMQH